MEMGRSETELFYGNMIRSVHMKSCYATQKRFMLFKGPGYF
jgi:hypothetical protein